MKTEVFEIIREAITLARVQRIKTVAQLKAKLLQFGREPEDVKEAFAVIECGVTRNNLFQY